MTTATYNLSINQGATFSRVFTWTVGGCCCTGTVGAASTPVDITGYSAAMQIRAYPLAVPVLYDASSNLTLGGPLGTVTLTIPAASTEGFTWWQGVYDILLTSPTGIATRLLMGSVTVSAGVTP